MKHRLVSGAVIAFGMSAILAAASSSPVADAAMKGDREALRTLLKQGADVSGAQGDGMSALHYAAERGDAEMTEMGLAALDKGLEQLQDSYSLRMQRGYLRLSNGHFTDAEADYRRAVELQPALPSPKIGLAFVLLQNQRQPARH